MQTTQIRGLANVSPFGDLREMVLRITWKRHIFKGKKKCIVTLRGEARTALR